MKAPYPVVRVEASPMPRLMRRSFLVLALLGAWALLARDHAPLPFTVGEAVAGPAARGEGSSDVVRNGDRPPHDLSALKVFNKVIIYVKDNYVDPKRVKPKEMMIAALEYVEKQRPRRDGGRQRRHGQAPPQRERQARATSTSATSTRSGRCPSRSRTSSTSSAKNMRPMRGHPRRRVRGRQRHALHARPALGAAEARVLPGDEAHHQGRVRRPRLRHPDEGGQPHRGARCCPRRPASRAGIKKDDQIKKIGDESTVNMDLNEAVSKLRGPVDSRGHHHRRAQGLGQAAGPDARPRDHLHRVACSPSCWPATSATCGSRTSRATPPATCRRRCGHAAERRRGRAAALKGLVLDLRGNPGGLLEQAIQVSDLFVSARAPSSPPSG